jgi:hypothetical protein
MGLEDRDGLLGGRDFLAPEHSALGLVDYPAGEIDLALQLRTQGQSFNTGVVLGYQIHTFAL